MKVIDAWQSDVKMFTAFDVTKQLRKDGESVAHWEVRDEVRRLFAIGEFGTNYDRQLVNVMGNSTFVYFDSTTGADPDMYDPQWLNNAASTPSTPFDAPIPASPTVAPSVGAPATQHIANLTGENRLNISSVLLRKMGAQPGDLVDVETVIGFSVSVPAIIVKRCSIHNLYPQSQIVDTDGRIRISGRTLTKAFGPIQNKSSFIVRYDNKDNAIYVTA